MKYITNYRSPNYNSRNQSEIKFIIIHYTALKNTKDAITFLCAKEKKVSSHYLISQDGLVYNLVNDKFRAWHAGHSFWQDSIDINSISIGIELDYSPNGNNNKFSFKMISSLKKLINKLKKKYKINKKNILAHSDVAPFRKNDPGKHFPWRSFAKSNITLNLQNIKKSDIRKIEDWFYKYNIKSKKRAIVIALSIIGYDTREVYKNIKFYNKLILAYKSKYMDNNNFVLHSIVMKHLFKFMLTKN